ncbi:MAG: iron donor protein CyaY [Rhodocyclaceae bacterium]|nr:iron donor protein CyaY [Rhodocyclaceae bacterium]
MDEAAFNVLAEAELTRIEQALEAFDDDIELEVQPGGVLELEFVNGSKVVINRHTAAREIWVAARSGGFHFRPESGKWLGTRDGVELYAALGRIFSEQAGRNIDLSAGDE